MYPRETLLDQTAWCVCERKHKNLHRMICVCNLKVLCVVDERLGLHLYLQV